MRSDMSKVIVERPRLNPKMTRRGRPVDPESAVKNQSMRSHHVRNYSGKELNENLAPLHRFLGSRVGQRWDDVFSEICENIRLTNTVQKHVRDHIQHMVSTNIRIDADGEIWVNNGSAPFRLSVGFSEFWVDPRNGLLQRNKDFGNWKRRNQEYLQRHLQEQMKTSLRLDDGTEVRKVNGIWYAVTLAPVPPRERKMFALSDGYQYETTVGGSAFDVVLNHTVYNYRGFGFKYATTYCCAKRQLNHAELKKWNLVND